MIIFAPVLRKIIKIKEGELYMNYGDHVEIGELREGVLDVFKDPNSIEKAEKLFSKQKTNSSFIVKFDGGHAVITKKLHQLFIRFKSYIDENLEGLTTLNHYEVAELCAVIRLLEDSCNHLLKVPMDKKQIYQQLSRANNVLKNITKDVWTIVDPDLRAKTIDESSNK